jgi:hypothetical protein
MNLDLDGYMVAWNTKGAFKEEDGRSESIEVGPWPDKTGWSKGYRFTVGCCFLENHTMPAADKIAQMFMDFHTCVVRDGIDPQKAHADSSRSANTADAYRRISKGRSKAMAKLLEEWINVELGQNGQNGQNPDVPSEWIEGCQKLKTIHRRVSIPRMKWIALLNAVDRFMERWAAQAAKPGWQAVDLFGCHPEVPEARVDCQGLCWFLANATLVDLTAQAASIRLKSGTVQTYSRMPAPAGAVMIWDL